MRVRARLGAVRRRWVDLSDRVYDLVVRPKGGDGEISDELWWEMFRSGAEWHSAREQVAEEASGDEDPELLDEAADVMKMSGLSVGWEFPVSPGEALRLVRGDFRARRLPPLPRGNGRDRRTPRAHRGSTRRRRTGSKARSPGRQSDDEPHEADVGRRALRGAA